VPFRERVEIATRKGRRGWDQPAPGVEEPSFAVDPVTPLVDGTVMAAAEQDQVAERRLASESPVVDVVGVDEPPVLATGEAATPVARSERPPRGRRDCA